MSIYIGFVGAWCRLGYIRTCMVRGEREGRKGCMYLKNIFYFFYVHPLLKAPPDARVEAPRDVGGTEHEHAHVYAGARALHAHQKLVLHPARCVGLAIRAAAAKCVDLVDEDDRGLLLGRHLEEVTHQPLRLAQPLGDEVGGGDREEGAVHLRRNRLGEVRLASPGWSVEKYPLPRLAVAREQVGKADGQDHRLLQSLLGALQTGHVVPLHVGLLGENGRVEPRTQLALVRIALALLPARAAPICANRAAAAAARVLRPGRAALLAAYRVLELLGPVHVLRDLLAQRVLCSLILFVFEPCDKVLQRSLIQAERLLVALLLVRRDRLRDQLDGLWYEVVVLGEEEREREREISP
mmetsp:Transcript_34984/g.82491  ORF Transcript_34984/g.82491 Transcript_34984/m.82491 type:complete len:353 (-) Transcript_34984:182-1240(-)